MNRFAAPVVLVSIVVVAIQLSLLSSLRVFGAVIMLVWLWPLCLGLVGETALGVTAGVVCGLLFDAHATTPFGLTALAGAALAYGAARLGREGVGDLDSSALWVAPILAAGAGSVVPLLYCVCGLFVLDLGLWRGGLTASMLTNLLAFGLLARPVMRVARWLAGGTGRRRV